jgi:hypothetical protein
MSHRIDTAVNAMQTAFANARKHSVVTQTGMPKLMDRHNSTLSSGHLGHPQIPAVTLLGHMPIKVTSGLDSPPWRIDWRYFGRARRQPTPGTKRPTRAA